MESTIGATPAEEGRGHAGGEPRPSASVSADDVVSTFLPVSTVPLFPLFPIPTESTTVSIFPVPTESTTVSIFPVPTESTGGAQGPVGPKLSLASLEDLSSLEDRVVRLELGWRALVTFFGVASQI